MAISKIILNGVTQIDLTQDTVEASNLLSSYTAHKADGTAVTGTATSGVDIPTFTVTWNSDFSAIQSVTCNKSYAECYALYDDGSSIAMVSESDGIVPPSLISANVSFVVYDGNVGHIIYTVSLSNGNIYDLDYASTGNITATYPSQYNLTLNATVNGTYYPNDGVYTEVNINVPTGSPTLQTKSVTPTESSQTVTPDNGYDGLSSVSVGAISNSYVGSGITRRSSSDLTVSGNTVTAPAGYYASSASATTSGGSMNVQVAQSTSRASSSTYTNLISLTCSKAGTYDIYWDCFRSSTSGTSGSQLYIGGSAYGAANTTFTNHIQNNHLTGVTLAANDTVAVYARSRGSNYYAYVGTLIIKQTA